MGNIGTAIGSAALGGLTGGVGGLVTGAIGGIGSLLGLGSRKEKKARVLPQYDIRTDKWDIAQSAMDLANASKIAKSKGLKKPEETKQTEEPKPTE